MKVMKGCWRQSAFALVMTHESWPSLLRASIRYTSSAQKIMNRPTRAFSVSATARGQSLKLGFIGLGNMGGPMARNLISQGHPAVIFDIFPENMEALSDTNAQIASSSGDVGNCAETIITMLPASQNVIDVYLGDKGILKTVKPGTLLIDSSTIDPGTAKMVAAEAEKKGAMYMDAPVSGGVNAAKAATLTFMVGAKSKGEFEAAKILLSSMGKNIVHCGDVGMGQAAKICNNMLLAISMIGTAETMNLGIRLGLDAKLLASILNSSSGRCWSSEVYNPVPGILENVPSSKDYEGGFGAALMTKDLGLAATAANSTHTPIPLGSLAHQIYRLMLGAGFGGKDFSSVYKFLQQQK